MMTYDQWREMVAEAVAKHISCDKTVCVGDYEWEIDNLTESLGRSLRINGYQIPDRPPERQWDLSEFE